LQFYIQETRAAFLDNLTKSEKEEPRIFLFWHWTGRFQ